MIVHYSVSNRQRNAFTTVVVVGLAGESDEVNEDVVERAVERYGRVVAAVSPVPVVTTWPLLVADGRALPLLSKSVHVVISNAVIEHVGLEADQRAFVDEHVRVGQSWIITTPNRWFPVESHTSVLFQHWSPQWRVGRDEFTRILSRREFADLLPQGTRIFGRFWSPTFTACGPGGPSPAV
jgi:hypothetical protein